MQYLSPPPPDYQVHYAPAVPGYLPGEQVAASIITIEDDAPIALDLQIETVEGSGFAGQVYQGRVLSATPRDWPERLAVKVLRPRSRWKRLVRDSLFWLCFQAPFAPQIDEAAVRSGLLWQVALRTAALKTAAAISMPASGRITPAISNRALLSNSMSQRRSTRCCASTPPLIPTAGLRWMMWWRA
jgi:hypothetical protein